MYISNSNIPTTKTHLSNDKKKMERNEAQASIVSIQQGPTVQTQLIINNNGEHFV